MNIFDKLLARIHAAEIAAKVRPRRARHKVRHPRHEAHERHEHAARGGGRAHTQHHRKRAGAHHAKHRKGHGR